MFACIMVALFLLSRKLDARLGVLSLRRVKVFGGVSELDVSALLVQVPTAVTEGMTGKNLIRTVLAALNACPCILLQNCTCVLWHCPDGLFLNVGAMLQEAVTSLKDLDSLLEGQEYSVHAQSILGSTAETPDKTDDKEVAVSPHAISFCSFFLLSHPYSYRVPRVVPQQSLQNFLMFTGKAFVKQCD